MSRMLGVWITYSSGSSTFFALLSRNWPLSAAVKKGEKERTSS